MANINGTNDNDVLNGTTSNDLINGLAGNDKLDGKGGNDTLSGGFGNDTLLASSTTGNNTLNGDAGDDYLNIDHSTGDNLLSGGDGNDSLGAILYEVVGRNTLNGGNGDDFLYLGTSEIIPSSLVTQTVDGGTGDDTLSVDYRYVTKGITSTLNATTNIGSITAGTNQVSFKNIERLDITGGAYDDYLVGTNGDDDLFGGVAIIGLLAVQATIT